MSTISNRDCICCAEEMKGRLDKKEITCLFCSKGVCRSCCEIYLLDQSTARCMFPECGKEWSTKFMVDQFTISFITTKYKKHKENIYFEREKALLPATQVLVVDIIKTEKLSDSYRQYRLEIKKIVDKYLLNVNVLKSKWLGIWAVEDQRPLPTSKNEWYSCGVKQRKTSKYICFFDHRYKDEHKVISRLSLAERKVAHDKSICRLKLINGNDGKIKTKKVVERRFIRKCPVEECKGFLSSGWKCGLCDTKACSKCHIPLVRDTEHTCDPDALATAELIVSESKPCPGCSINITKIDGCNQMWCTQCNTAWDWVSGRIETRIHNPHYFEYLRTRNLEQRNPLEVQCGRELDAYFCNSFYRILDRLNWEEYTSMSMIRMITRLSHIIRYDLPSFVDDGDTPDTTVLRIAYLRNVINEDVFKRRVQMRHKRHSKRQEVKDIIVMYTQLAVEIIYRFKDTLSRSVSDGEPITDDSSYFEEMNGLRKYTNECFQSVGTTYKSVSSRIKVDFSFR